MDWFIIPCQSHSRRIFLFTSVDFPSSYNLPTAASYNASLVVGIGAYIHYDLTGLSDCFLVVFDSGDSLSISHLRSDFIGSIIPIPYLRLGVMVNGIIIEGKGIVKWHLRAKKRHLPLNMSATMLMNAKFD